jgi:nucleoside-diphosphate-sugar epimerase
MLITGAAGFVGFELVQRLRSSGCEVIAAVGPVQHDVEAWRLGRLRESWIALVELDLRRKSPFKDIPRDWNVLFHLAAYVRTEDDSEDVEINDGGTRRLLEQLSSTLGGAASCSPVPSPRLTPRRHRPLR